MENANKKIGYHRNMLRVRRYPKISKKKKKANEAFGRVRKSPETLGPQISRNSNSVAGKVFLLLLLLFTPFIVVKIVGAILVVGVASAQ